jgi:Spy/CpxP family protein refolding chaperone
MLVGQIQKLERLMEQLNLTPEQSEQIKAIKEQSKTEAQAQMEQMQTSRQEMRSLFASDASTEQLRQQHQQVEQLHQQLGINRFETMLRIREVLTSEQRVKIAELMEQHHGKRFDL